MFYRGKALSKLLLLSLLLLPCAARAQMSITLTGPAGNIAGGSTIKMTAFVENTLTPLGPVVLTGSVACQDWLGTNYLFSSVPDVIPIIQPMTIQSVSLTLPPSLTYVTGSASSTVPVTGTTTAGVLTLSLGSTGYVALEGQGLNIGFSLLVAK